MHQGKAIIAILTISVLVGFSAGAADLVAGHAETVTNFVAEETTSVQDGRILTSGGGRIEKTGKGVWVLPENVRQSTMPIALTVTEGTVRLTESAGQVPTLPKPTEILEKAAMWLDASVETSFDKTGDSVNFWYDCRETDNSAPQHLYAKAILGATIDNKWSYTAPAPELKTKDGITAVWFGGRQSSRSMSWYNPDGTLFSALRTNFDTAMEGVRHVFVLRGEFDFHGVIVGGIQSETKSGVSYAMNGGEDITTPTSFGSVGDGWGKYMTEMRASRDVRLYENGVAKDPVTTYPCRGFALYDISMQNEPMAFNTFFNNANRIGDDCSVYGGNRGGGEYIAEAIVFTNVLTETERLLVSDYLMAKWLGTKAAQKVDLRLGLSGCVEAPLSQVASVDGSGVLAPTDGSDIVFDSKERALPGWSVKPGSAAVTLTKTMPLSLEAGEALTGVKTEDGPRVSVGDALSDDALVLDPGEAQEISLSGFPSDVRSLKVASGRVTIRPAGSAFVPSEVPLERVTIRNAGFENSAGWGGMKPSGVRTIKADADSYDGWLFKQIASGGSAYLYRYTSFTRTGKWWYLDVPPPEGECLVTLGFGWCMQTHVSLPNEGVYEVSCHLAGRKGYLGAQVELRLVPTAGGTSIFLGRAFGDDSGHFRKLTYRADVPAGEYDLVFDKTRGAVGDLYIDNVVMCRVAAHDDGSYAIPGGDFEDIAFETTDENVLKVFQVGGSSEHWRFTGSVGPATYMMRSATCDYGLFYNSLSDGLSGSVQLAFTNEANAVTTFRPPAGTWQLQARVGYMKNAANLEASVVVGNAAMTTLGAVKPLDHQMGLLTWPAWFTTDGNTDVTLTVASPGDMTAGAGIIVDEFRLVPFAGELVQNGGFEDAFAAESDPTRNWRSVKCTSENGSVERKAYTASPEHVGYSIYEGKYRAAVAGDAYVYQIVTFPQPGRYRLSFHMSHRYEPGYPTWTSYDSNPVRTWLTRGGAYTNQIGTVSNFTTNYVQHVFDFVVPEAGEWDFAIGGTDLKSRTSLVDGVSIMPILGEGVTPSFGEDLVVEVASGARLDLPFDGTNKVSEVRLGGRRVSGVISADRFPDCLSGTGCYYVEPQGSVLVFR